MPKVGTVYADIPAKVKSFKVYDDGGANGTYSDNSDGSVVFKAPTGYLLKITGKVIAERTRDKLYVYDGDAVNENNLLVTVSGRASEKVTDYATNIPTNVISSGESMTIRFYSDVADNYAGLNLTIELVKSMANMTVADIASQTYTGSAICPDVVVTDGGKTLVKNTDYTVACSNNVNAGTATVTITGRGGYSGEVEKTFEISPKSIADPSLEFIYEKNHTYNGSPIVPDLVVKDGEKTLVSGTDYTAKRLYDATNAGNKKITVTGKGNYAGTFEALYTIAPKEISIAWGEQTSFTYNGEEQLPTATVVGLIGDDQCDAHVASKMVIDDEWYWEMAIDAGEYVAAVDYLSNSNYKLPETGIEKPFSIAPKSIAGFKYVYEKNHTYTGSEIKPDLVVYDGEKLLSQGTDYWVRYASSTTGSINITNVGKKYIIFTGKGNYTKQFTLEYYINPKEISIIWGNRTSFEYNGKAQVRPAKAVGLIGNDRCVVAVSAGKYVDNEWVDVDAINVGEYTARAYELGNSNYKLPSPYPTTTFSIVPKSIGGLEFVYEKNWTYTGSAICPEVVVKDGGKTLVKNTNYTVVCSDNVNAGTATAKITGLGVYAGEVEKQFTIVPEESDFAAVQVLKDQNGTRAVIKDYTGMTTLNIPDAIKVEEIDYERALAPLTPATTVLPFSLPEGTTLNAKFYYVQEVEQEGCSWSAVMKYIGEGNLPQANTPYAVILNKGEEKLEFDLHGKQATVQTAAIADQYDATKKWIFKGVYSYKVWGEKDPEIGLAYAFSGKLDGAVPIGSFGRIAKGAYAVPMRSYLRKVDKSVRLNCSTQASPAAARAWGAAPYTANFNNAAADIINVKFVEDDDNGKEKTTAIGRLNTATGEIKIDRWYDLKGRKVNNVNRAAKGVYYRRKIIDERR